MWTSVLLVHPVTHDALSNFEIFAMVNLEIFSCSVRDADSLLFPRLALTEAIVTEICRSIVAKASDASQTIAAIIIPIARFISWGTVR